jgi:hypothetical protein
MTLCFTFLVGVFDLAGDLLLLRILPLLRLWLGDTREADRDLFSVSPETHHIACYKYLITNRCRYIFPHITSR